MSSQLHALAALAPVPTVQEAGCAPGSVRTGAENIALTGTRSPDLQHVQSRHTDYDIPVLQKIEMWLKSNTNSRSSYDGPGTFYC